jgi:hypothetical protein
MDKRFLTAFLSPPKFNVGGFLLDPFCLRHQMILKTIGSPLLNPDVSPSFVDLIIGIKVCSTKSWDDIDKNSFWEKVKFFKIKHSIPYQLKVSFEFAQYLKDSLSIPKVWVEQKSDQIKLNNKEKIPGEIMMVTIMMSKFGFTESEAWNMPISKVMWYLTAYSIIEGAEVETISTEQEDREKDDVDRIKEIEKLELERIKKKSPRKDIKIS